MKTRVFSYSLTGNNEALAHSLAAAFQAEHARIAELGRRTMGTIVLDVIFNRTPPVRFPVEDPVEDREQYDLVLFVGPVWMGQIGTPLRACFKQLRSKTGKHASVSTSGGADGPNLKLGKEPVSVIDPHIADLLPPESKPMRRDTSVYRISTSDTQNLADKVVAILQEARSFRVNRSAGGWPEKGSRPDPARPITHPRQGSDPLRVS